MKVECSNYDSAIVPQEQIPSNLNFSAQHVTIIIFDPLCETGYFMQGNNRCIACTALIMMRTGTTYHDANSVPALGL